MTMLRAVVSGLVGMIAVPAFAAEISLISGLLKTNTRKENGSKVGSDRTIELGGRYGDLLGDDVHWFGEANISLRSFDAENGATAPSDATNLRLGGGMRLHFPSFSTAVTPYLLAGGAFVNNKDGTIGATAATSTSTEVNGLFYNASFGFRFNLSNDFFAELETKLFESALFATEEQVVGPNKVENSRFDLFVTTHKDTTPVSVNVGMKF